MMTALNGEAEYSLRELPLASFERSRCPFGPPQSFSGLPSFSLKTPGVLVYVALNPPHPFRRDPNYEIFTSPRSSKRYEKLTRDS